MGDTTLLNAEKRLQHPKVWDYVRNCRAHALATSVAFELMLKWCLSMPLFSYKNRPVHLGPFPLEALKRKVSDSYQWSEIPQMGRLKESAHPASLAPAIRRYLAMMDTCRDGDDVHEKADIPVDPLERANHLKSAAYYFDASMVGICALKPHHHLEHPRINPDVRDLRQALEHGELSQFSSGVEQLYQSVLASTKNQLEPVRHHTHAIVMLTEYRRDPAPNEKGADWIYDIQAERAALLTSNTATLIANYIRLLGFEARAHSIMSSEVDLNRLSISSGLCALDPNEKRLKNPFVGERFGLAAVTTTLPMATDQPLDPDVLISKGLGKSVKWVTGFDGVRSAANADPYAKRDYARGPHPFETVKRVETPTTYMDEPNIPRIPKQANFFIRAIYGDLGKKVQDASIDDMFVAKSPMGGCAWRALASLLLLQFGDARRAPSDETNDAKRNANNIKGASYFLSVDAVGLSRAPDWAYYSHDGEGTPLTPYHDSAISLLLDQGHETMEGASGDDWISVAQSMRAYLRFSLLGGVIAEHIRKLGHSARVHTVLDGDVIQPPLLLLAGLGEVSRIGDVILNPFLGPRLKSGVITTSMPMTYDKPIDFGLQNFCANCNKCARECPSGAITAGPKTMFNGYEIWKSDAEKCTRYRITNEGGGMCGRCMKTCPWNLEGLFSDAAFRWLATNTPHAAKTLAKLDDRLGRGTINPVKKWWWDIEFNETRTRCVQAKVTNRRALQKEIVLKHEDQSLAAYPIDLAPRPYPVMQPIDRNAGIKAYRLLPQANVYRERKARGDPTILFTTPDLPSKPPVFPVLIAKRDDLTDSILRLELIHPDGLKLPPFTAGAHIDVVIAPEFHRQFSLAGDPSDHSKYVLGIQKEADGRGGSQRLHKAFHEGRKIHISRPRNHFPLDESAPLSLLMAGGIGVTPMIAMAHRLHQIDRAFILHFSARSAVTSGFDEELKNVAWANSAHCHFSDVNGRANLQYLIPQFRQGYKLYVCGSQQYMDAVLAAATAKSWPESACTHEYFSVPEQGDYEDHAFTLKLASSGKIVQVSAEQSAAEALQEEGVRIDVKCSDGLCGVCVARYRAGEVEHRDFVLSSEERASKLALCCSRARQADGIIEIDI